MKTKTLCYVPLASRLNECCDSFGTVNFGKLHSLCIDFLNEIEAHRQGSGRRTRASLYRLASVMTAFLERKQFSESTARRWFFEQPHAEFCLQLFADECDHANEHEKIGKQNIDYAAILERSAARKAGNPIAQ